MIGKLNKQKKEATIVGAGISGLLMGYFLKKKGYSIKIFEQSARAGGLIQTTPTPFGIAESAAHSLLIHPGIQPFFDELKVPLIPVHPNSKARFIFRRGKMRRFPLTFSESFRTLYTFFSSHPPLHPEVASLEDWCNTYLGTPAHDSLLSAFISGVYACSPRELNASLTFPKLLPSMRTSFFKHLRSLPKKRYRSQMMAPLNGMSSLVDALAKNLKTEIFFNTSVTEIPTGPNVILCVPSQALAELLNAQDPISAQFVKKVTYAPLVTVTAFYDQSAFTSSPPQGVGILAAKANDPFHQINSLGVLFNSSSFPERTTSTNSVSLTFMLGGTANPDMLNLSDDQILQKVESDSKSLFRTRKSPVFVKITRWPKAIPLYSNELLQCHRSLEARFCATPGRIVFSNYSGQVSIRGMIETLIDL